MNRNTPLKRTAPLKRGTTKMRPKGARAERWAEWQKQERNAVIARAGKRCEYEQGGVRCGVKSVDLHWHHLAGRKHIIEEPWASWRYLTTWLCPTHHEDAHLHISTIGELLRWMCVERLVDAFDLEDVEIMGTHLKETALDTIKKCVRQLKERNLDLQKDPS